MADMSIQKMHEIIGALYATIAVHEATIAELRLANNELAASLVEPAQPPEDESS